LCRKASHPEATLLEKPYLNAPIKSISWAQPLMPHMWAKWFWMLHQHPPASTSIHQQLSPNELRWISRALLRFRTQWICETHKKVIAWSH
jgi:hypothetical protein